MTLLRRYDNARDAEVVLQWQPEDFPMPTLKLTDQQVVELVKQLPQDRQASLVRDLLAQQWPEWDALTRVGEVRIRIVAAERGREWDMMSDEERLSFVDDLVHEDRPCMKS
jgi:hypothetical protein